MGSKDLFVFILGMHHSGTSCLAGCLERCGLYLGDVRRTGRFNARGYYEIRQVQHLHDQILGFSQGSWYRPPEQILVHPRHRQALEETARQLSRHRPCGLKDPRLVLLLDTWREIARPPHALVGTFRHPLAVARSLARRNGIPEKEGIDLWVEYNTTLVRWHETSPFPIVEFDLSDVDAYCRTVAALALELGLAPNLHMLQRFVSSELDHHRVAGASIPPACREAYAYLRRHRFQPAITDGELTEFNPLLGAWQQVRYLYRAQVPDIIRRVAAFAARFPSTLP